MRLIDADLLPKYTGYVLNAVEVAKAVEEAPTVEAEPIVHAHWIENGYYYACSRCGEDVNMYDEASWEQYFPRCPNCGAKMDEATE